MIFTYLLLTIYCATWYHSLKRWNEHHCCKHSTIQERKIRPDSPCDCQLITATGFSFSCNCDSFTMVFFYRSKEFIFLLPLRKQCYCLMKCQSRSIPTMSSNCYIWPCHGLYQAVSPDCWPGLQSSYSPTSCSCQVRGGFHNQGRARHLFLLWGKKNKYN